MKNIFKIVLIVTLLAAPALMAGGEGKGTLKLGYVFLDEEGNRAVNQPTFNTYEGMALGFEDLNYRFDNGVQLRANLKYITLNNRNLNFAVSKFGHFGLNLFNHQYRRVYNFNGSDFTRRHRTGAKLWVQPHKYLRVFGGMNYIGKSGRMLPYYDLNLPENPEVVDYKQTEYNVGMRFNYRQRMFFAEYKSGDFNDDALPSRNQNRYRVRLLAMTPVPKYEWIVLTGGFRRFETKFETTEFSLSSNRVWGGATVQLPMNFSVKYGFFFDRTSSDSDLVATDNLGHAIYASKLWPGMGGLTAGFQYDINDDYYDAVNATSGYFYGWFKPLVNLEFRGEFGFRSEEVDDGSRLLGDEDRNRFKISSKYTRTGLGAIEIRYEEKNRKNDQLGSEVDFQRIGIEGSYELLEYASVMGGYAYATGEYKNDEEKFEFADHVLHGDLMSKEFYNLTGGVGVVYYRSKRDLDVERTTLRLNATYKFMPEFSIEVIYNVQNFDDYLVLDNYYTANIVEVNLVKIMSF